MNVTATQDKPCRIRTRPIKKWHRKEEILLINFLKQNTDFELPVARVYYTKFSDETGVEVDWKMARSKVRNMRIAYRRAKEFEFEKMEQNDDECNIQAIRNEVLKSCWYVDEFDVIFPNDLANFMYKKSDISFDDPFLNIEPTFLDKSAKDCKPKPLLDEELTCSSFSKSPDRDVSVENNSKSQKPNEETILKQQELDLLKDKLCFERDKFRQEIKLREREIESREKLKLMELQMQERIAMKELELKEKLAQKSITKQEATYNNVFHNLT